jgi:hypothetical protein
MWTTTFIELGFFVWQIESAIQIKDVICLTGTIVPVFTMSCSGAISAIIILNFLCSFMYLYFCAVAWEYAIRGEEDPTLIAKEAAR